MELSWLFPTIASVFMLIVSAVVARMFNLLDKKANKESTNDRFEQMFTRLDKHLDECREDKKDTNKTLTEIRDGISETKTALAVLSSQYAPLARQIKEKDS